MSTPDTLPMEITLIALPLFKFQVYSTSLRHYYHRPITLSTFQLLHQSQLYTPWHQSTPCDYLSRSSFVHRIGALHTHNSLTQPQLPGVQLQHLSSTSISFPKLIFTSIAHVKSHGTHLRQYCGHHQSL
jgi:hypothetical protein